MKAVALGYHDVFDGALPDDGGLRPHAAHYALDRASFRQHIEAIQKHAPHGIETIDGLREWTEKVPVFLTFDDGAVGSYACIAEELEKINARGHFFIVSSWIGRTGFMDRCQIRQLHQRGHVIGSHSRSHPERMANLPREQLRSEWSESCAALSDILGAACRVASVPNGYYSAAVSQTAIDAGITVLFNSEPTRAATMVNACLVLGRYAIKAGDGPQSAQGLVSKTWPRLRQTMRWELIKTAKALGGTAFLTARTLMLSRKPQDSSVRESGK